MDLKCFYVRAEEFDLGNAMHMQFCGFYKSKNCSTFLRISQNLSNELEIFIHSLLFAHFVSTKLNEVVTFLCFLPTSLLPCFVNFVTKHLRDFH
jgi:hypothetical protein